MEPRESIRGWVSAFSRGDADAMADFYAEDAINHPVVRDPVVGREAIREMFDAGCSCATMACRIENLFQDGDWAILGWSDPNRGCVDAVSLRSSTIRLSFSEAISTNYRFSGSRAFRFLLTNTS